MPVTSRGVHRNAPVAYEYLTFTRPGATTASVTNAFRFRVARDAIIHQIELSASAVSGTSPTCSAALKRGAATLVSTANLTAAGKVVASPTLANQAVRAGHDLTVDLTVGGTSPSFTDINVVVVFRTGGPEFTGGVSL
jgi:hypothetical protein